jgi:hypothetical protein
MQEGNIQKWIPQKSETGYWRKTGTELHQTNGGIRGIYLLWSVALVSIDCLFYAVQQLLVQNKAYNQGGRARTDFSLAWLEAAWHSSGSGHGPTGNWRREAGVLKKLSLAGLAKLSRLRYSWLRLDLALANYHGLRGHNRLVYTAG